MSHANQIAFVRECASVLASVYPFAEVCEIGSYDVNGSVRSLFGFARSYVGVDLVPGPSVDHVAAGHEFGGTGSYDVVISCEAFEHNRFWLETFINMIRICRPGGTVLFTCASTGRLEHGTPRTSSEDSPGTTAERWNYYRNLTRRDFQRHVNLRAHFLDSEFFEVRSTKDLYFIGIKRSSFLGEAEPENFLAAHRNPLRAYVRRLDDPRAASAPSLGEIVYCLPLRVAARLLPDRQYQEFAMVYLRSRDPVRRVAAWFSRRRGG
ncbi:MAG: class I SAM-dependent methyltransferase [Acidiferrobacteraceae bacterium]